MKKKILKFLLIVLMIPCMVLFAACGDKNSDDGKNNGGGGGNGGGTSTEPDYSFNNPEYVEFRNIMNTVASAFGTDIGLGENANDKSSDNTASATAFVGSSGVGLDIGGVHETYFAYLDTLKTKTPDDTYSNPMYGFEQAMVNCFKMPVVMADAVTQYYGATTVYGKTLELGYDDPMADIVYYQINKTADTLSTTVYTPVSKKYTTGDQYVDGGYYYYYTEVKYISETNFKFYMILASEDNEINQIAVGDSDKNLLAFEFYPNPNIDGGIEYNLNYSNGISGKSMSLISDQNILDSLKSQFESTKAQVNIEFFDAITSPVAYQIKTADVDKVIDRIAKDMGFDSSNDEYPGWYIEDDIVLGYYGDGSGSRIEKLVIPSEFSAISGDFEIYSARVDELVIPSTIKTVKLRKGDIASRNNQQYTANDWHVYVPVDAAELRINVHDATSSSFVGKITLEGGSNLFSYDTAHCLFKKNTNTLIYVCDAPVTEYDFRGVTLNSNLKQGFLRGVRRNAKNIKKLSIDVICYLDSGMSPDETWSYWYKYNLLDMFMYGSGNNMKLDELNLYGLNMTPYALENNKNGYSIVLSPYEDLFPNVNYDIIENKFTSYIKKLNIYSNGTAFRLSNYFYATKLTATEKETVESQIIRFKINNPYDYYDLINDLPEYCMNIGLLPYTVVRENGITRYQFNIQIADQLFREIQIFSPLYEKYLYEQYVEKNGNNARVRLVDEINIFNNDGTPSTAEVEDLGAEEIKVTKIKENGYYFDKDTYPFLKTIRVEQSAGHNYNISVSKYYDEILDIYIPAGIMSVHLNIGTENKGGGQDPDAVIDSTAVRIHLPWTRTTFETYHQSKFQICGNYTFVYAEQDEVSTYSTWLYTTHWNDTTQTELKVLEGYFSVNPEMHEITLPIDVEIVYYDMNFIGNISKIIIPANYKYVMDYNMNLHESAVSLGNHAWVVNVKNPLTNKLYYSSTAEVAENSPLFAVDEDGNLCDKTKAVIIKDCFNLTSVLDLTDAKVIKNIEKIVEKADLSVVTEVVVDARVRMFENELGYLNYESASLWKNSGIREKLPNVTTITFKNIGVLYEEYTNEYLDALVEKYKDDIMQGIDSREDILVNLKNIVIDNHFLTRGTNKNYTLKLEGSLAGSYFDMTRTFEYLFSADDIFTGRIAQIYANGTLVTAENIESFGFSSGNTRFADNSPITELIITSNKTNPYIYYTAGTITKVRFAEGVTDADFSIFQRINYNGNNYSCNTELITDVYFDSTVVCSTSCYSFVETYDKVVNIHFNMTKQEFIDSLEGIEDDFSNHDLLKWFDWYSAFDRDLYNPNYDSPDPFIDQLEDSNYDKFVNADETCGMRFYFTDTEL